MKRYRLFAVSFDTRPEILQMKVKDEWEEKARRLWVENKQKIVEGIGQQYGEADIDRKVADFTALGREPFSVIAFHNRFLHQCRAAFTAGCYYPALTGACALGERILNHMVLKLRDDYKRSLYYKQVYDKESFDNWDLAISALREWDIFVTIEKLERVGVKVEGYGSEVVDLFRELCALRNESIHFRIDLDFETREPALGAIHLLQEIVTKQFGVDGPQLWFIPGASGAYYIKRELEDHPFIREFYLPACAYVGPNHKARPIDSVWHIDDPGPYEDIEITDEEFAKLANSAR